MAMLYNPREELKKAALGNSEDGEKDLTDRPEKQSPSTDAEFTSSNHRRDMSLKAKEESIVGIDLWPLVVRAISCFFLKSMCKEEHKDTYLNYILSMDKGVLSVAALRHICALLKIIGVDVCKLK